MVSNFLNINVKITLEYYTNSPRHSALYHVIIVGHATVGIKGTNSSNWDFMEFQRKKKEKRDLYRIEMFQNKRKKGTYEKIELNNLEIGVSVELLGKKQK